MSLFANLKTDGLEKATDSLGGFQLLDSDIYTGVLKVAYAGESDGGAMNVTLVAELGGKNYTETIYITNKNKENFFLNKQDPTKKVPLPGFVTINDLCRVTCDKTIDQMDLEERVLKIWNSNERKEIPTKVQVLVELVDQPIMVAVLKQKENKSVKNDQTGQYEPTNEEVEKNTIEKVFHEPTKMTVVEIENQEENPVFYEAWEKKNKGVTRNKFKPVVGGAKGGAPKASSSGDATPKKSGLFGKK